MNRFEVSDKNDHVSVLFFNKKKNILHLLLQELNKFCDYYKNVKESDINEEQSKSLYSYFGVLNDVLMQFKSMLVDLDGKHSGIKIIRENVNNFNKYLSMGM